LALPQQQSRAFPFPAGLRRIPRTRSPQQSLFCPCGTAEPAIAGLCRPCYAQTRRSKARFGGHREAVLLRDRRQCQSCGAAHANPRRIHVHHRHPGHHSRKWLITLCAACHARVHRLAAVRRYLPPALLPLWAEQHPQVPLQLQLELAAPDGIGRG
jgi:5-methylcytosine-specific restriction endonuclease McrA